MELEEKYMKHLYLVLASTTILKEGMIVTDEPGIYIPDFGGVRIEDLCCSYIKMAQKFYQNHLKI